MALTKRQQQQLEYEERMARRLPILKQLQRELIQYCNKNRLDFIAAKDLIYSTKTYTEENYKSEHIFPYKAYAVFKKVFNEA